jgi:Flp pilus assembly protein TadD
MNIARSFKGFLVASAVLGTCGLLSCSRSEQAPPSAANTQSPEQAIATWQAATQKAPTYDNFTWLGLAYTRAGKHQEALAAFKRSSEINPSSSIAENNICSELNALRQWDSAIQHCKKAIELQASNQLAKNNLAQSERGKAADEPRIAQYKSNISAGKDVDANRVDLGNLYYQRGDYEQALTVWRDVQKGSPVFAVALNDIGSAYIVLRRFDEARKALDEALRLQPNNGLFKNNLAWLNHEAGAKGH